MPFTHVKFVKKASRYLLILWIKNQEICMSDYIKAATGSSFVIKIFESLIDSWNKIDLSHICFKVFSRSFPFSKLLWQPVIQLKCFCVICFGVAKNFLISTLELVNLFKRHLFLDVGLNKVMCTMHKSLIFATLIFQNVFWKYNTIFI